MIQVTESAAVTLDHVKAQNDIPPGYGIRLSGTPSPTGGVEVHIAFAEAPMADDTVDEQHGHRLFVAPEVAEPLAEATLDVTAPVSQNGNVAPQLVLRPQD